MTSLFRASKSPQRDVPSTKDELSTKGAYGLELCHDSPEAVADVIFVHGLTGNRHNTWTAKSENVFWPKDLLPADLPKTRIMTYGYDADIAHFWSMASQNRIGEHAGNLVNAIAQIRERTDTENRPIIFVTHSLGGLVTEDALLYSKNSAEPHLQDLVRSVVGICFLGTPHCGSNLANWGSVMGSLVNAIKTANIDLVNVLKTDSEVLARVQREFHTMLRGPTFEGKPPLKITCFFEELPVRGTGEIVPKHSAILSSYNAIGIRANHMDMTKFTSTDDPGYLSVSGELRRWVKALSQRQSAFGRQGEGAGVYAGSPYPPEPERNRYPPYSESVGSHPYGGQQYGGPPRQPSPYDAGGHRQSPYSHDPYQSPPPNQDPRLYPPAPGPWGGSQYSSTPPSANPRYPQQEAYEQHRPSYSPNYQRYQSGGGYAMSPPPPEPRYIENAPPAPGPDAFPPRWDARSPPSQHSHAVYQGSNVVTNNGSYTSGNGKSVQGNNIQAGGNISF